MTDEIEVSPEYVSDLAAALAGLDDAEFTPLPPVQSAQWACRVCGQIATHHWDIAAPPPDEIGGCPCEGCQALTTYIREDATEPTP